METVHGITEILREKKENWDREKDVKVSFKDIQTKVRYKASNWIKFRDGSGEIKIYAEDSIPYAEDLDLVGVGRDVILGGAALIMLPVAAPWIVGGIAGLRSSKIIGAAAFSKCSWKNTHIFVFNSLKECVFAMEFHYPEENEFIKRTLSEIVDAVVSLEPEYYEVNSDWYDEYSEYDEQEDESEDVS